MGTPGGNQVAGRRGDMDLVFPEHSPTPSEMYATHMHHLVRNTFAPPALKHRVTYTHCRVAHTPYHGLGHHPCELHSSWETRQVAQKAKKWERGFTQTLWGAEHGCQVGALMLQVWGVGKSLLWM